MDERNLPQIGCRELHIRRGTAKVSISRNLKTCSAPNRLAVFLKSPECPFCGRCINTFQTISPKHRATMSTFTRGQIGGNGWMPVSRRALTFTGKEDFGAYRQARLHERETLHAKIAAPIWQAFVRGEYDVSVFLAMKAVEISVGEASGKAIRSVLG